jgi:hypothetical protein
LVRALRVAGALADPQGRRDDVARALIWSVLDLP